MPQNSDLVSVCACALAQMKTRLGDNHFNCKQISDVYCIILNSASLQSCEVSCLADFCTLMLYNGFMIALL